MFLSAVCGIVTLAVEPIIKSDVLQSNSVDDYDILWISGLTAYEIRQGMRFQAATMYLYFKQLHVPVLFSLD